MTRILITGGSGLIGAALIPILETRGHVCTRLSHNLKYPGQLFWNIQSKQLDAHSIEGYDAIIHLAGENVGSSRWTKSKKELIRSSRVDGTRLLCEKIATLKYPPTVFLCASAIGFYGNRGTEELTEESSHGTGFLSSVVQGWEAATAPLDDLQIRKVLMRFGVILSRKGGALQKMLPPFKLGLGGKIGNGKQFMSWISLRDVVQAIVYLLEAEHIHGAVNMTSPNPVTNEVFTKVLGKQLKRPTIFPLPALVAKLTLGEMANDLLLASTKARPQKLQHHDFKFKHAHLELALADILGV